ncbi:MBL fold metallo-hydrolase [Aliamphritea spongicola]|uniref:MBL fold metallo-hydrolase n=1 Tax=Aliamphritea spongicola TaxID=707589 RepID=UPI00196B9A4A|nr:MBL fold metallo-hydrolase [Aliamphritea spongicola]MBN3563893.1 MBL fold metallo-hydrolase [Aliamphritea spongicola]
MKKWQIASTGCVATLGVFLGIATSASGSGLTSWMSGNNHNRIIQVQNEGGVQQDSGQVEIAYYANSAFRITSPRGISVMVDPWRNDPSGAWGLWYRMEFPKENVDIGASTHAHFDHDALDKLDANMLLDRMAGTFTLGDITIRGIADKHQCVAPGMVPWTEAVKQFEGREQICAPTNARHMDNTLFVIETGGMSFLMWGDNRPEPPQEVWDQIGEVDVVFVPVDGSEHILDYEQANAVVEKTGAKAAIPHHYLVPETTFYTSTLLPADEWVKTHPFTNVDAPSFNLSKADLEGKTGHVYYFGSNNMVTAKSAN